MRLLIIVAGLVLVLGGPVVAKELKVMNSADFAQLCCRRRADRWAGCRPSRALAGRYVRRSAGGVCRHRHGDPAESQNIGQRRGDSQRSDHHSGQRRADRRCGAGVHDQTMYARPSDPDQRRHGRYPEHHDRRERRHVYGGPSDPKQSATADLRNLRILGNQLRSTVANGISFMHTGALEDAVIAENTLETNGGAGIGFRGSTFSMGASARSPSATIASMATLPTALSL
jgi:hypothetical protein